MNVCDQIGRVARQGDRLAAAFARPGRYFLAMYHSGRYFPSIKSFGTTVSMQRVKKILTFDTARDRPSSADALRFKAMAMSGKVVTPDRRMDRMTGRMASAKQQVH